MRTKKKSWDVTITINEDIVTTVTRERRYVISSANKDFLKVLLRCGDSRLKELCEEFGDLESETTRGVSKPKRTINYTTKSYVESAEN